MVERTIEQSDLAFMAIFGMLVLIMMFVRSEYDTRQNRRKRMGFKVLLKRGNTEDLEKYDIDKYEVVYNEEKQEAVIGTGDGYIPLSDCDGIKHLFKELHIKGRKAFIPDSDEKSVAEMKIEAALMRYEILSGAYADDDDNIWWMSVVPGGKVASKTVMVHPEIDETREELVNLDMEFYGHKTEEAAVRAAYEYIKELADEEDTRS